MEGTGNLSGREWMENPAPADPSLVSHALSLGIPLPLATMLGRCSFLVSPDELDRFIAKDFGQLRSPFLLDDMEKAVELAVKALENRDEILICGDFDVDGLTGTSVLYWGLRKASAHCHPNVHVPNRFTEGHGLDETVIRHWAKKGVKLLITVDCGMGSPREVRLARDPGLEVIVTDHHLPEGEIPPASALVNPTMGDYPFAGLAGVGVGFKFVQALLLRIFGQESEVYRSAVENLIDYVAMGTIADVVPLIDENRILVHWGLRHMNESRLPFLKHYWNERILNQQMGEEYGEDHVAFFMAPRLNAASRLETPEPAFRFLTSVLEKDVQKYGAYLEYLNRERIQRLDKLKNSSVVIVHSFEDIAFTVMDTKGDEVGLLGLLASNMVDRTGHSVLALARGTDGLLNGSLRSNGCLHLQEFLGPLSPWLERFGGHRDAAGLAIKPEQLPGFLQHLQSMEAKESHRRVAGQQYDFRLELSAVDAELMNQIDLLGPFGFAFTRPTLCVGSCGAANLRRMGRGGTTLGFELVAGERHLKAVAFGWGERQALVKKADFFVGTLTWNNFRGSREIQFQMKDVILCCR